MAVTVLFLAGNRGCSGTGQHRIVCWRIWIEPVGRRRMPHASVLMIASPLLMGPAPLAGIAEVSAFSRHATWWSRLGAPLTLLVQRLVTNRYLRAL